MKQKQNSMGRLRHAEMGLACTLILALCMAPYGVGQGKGNKGGGGGGGGTPNPEITYVDTRSGNLSVANADGTNARAVFAKGRNDVVYWPTWSPDGLAIAYWGIGPGGQGVYAVNLDGSGQRLVAPTMQGYERVDWAREPAPDGERKICFPDWAPGTQVLDIFLVNADGTGLVNLTNTPGIQEHYAFWMGNRLAYLRGMQIFAITLGLDGGGNVYAVSEELIYELPSGVPATTLRAANAHPWLVFSMSDGLKIVDLAAQPPTIRALTTQPSGSIDQWSCFSPDDSKVVFDRLTSAGRSLYTINSNGTGEFKIVAKAQLPSWKQPPPPPPGP